LTVDDEAPHRDLLHKKNLALLVYLARSPAQTRTREHLMELLWPGRDEKTARHSLREAIRVIKRHAGEEVIAAESDRVRLAEGSIRLDTDELERLRRAESWQEAAGLVRGEFLDGFGVPGAVDFDHWLTAERMAWAHVSLQVLVGAANELMNGGRIGEAVEMANRALASEPGADAGVQVVMSSMALAGDRAGALAQFDAFAERLSALDAQPDRKTLDLAERVRKERKWQQAATAAEKTGAESRRAPLVGRGVELQRLGEAWATCRRKGVPGMVLIEGDPGVGRTRLADEFLARARLDGAITVSTRAVAADLAERWSGVTQLLGGGLAETPGAAGADPGAVAVLARYSDEWAERFPGARGEESGDDLGRAFREALRAVCGEHDVVLFVDDAHWLDAESLRTLHAVLRDLSGTKLFLVLSVFQRSAREELDEMRARIGRDFEGDCIRLDPLTMDDLRSLVGWAMPEYAPEQCDRLARRVSTDSGGLPLLAVELLHAVAVGLDLARLSPDWPQPLRTLDQTLPAELPETAVGAIRVGFRRLSKAAQEVLLAAAVLGDRVPTARLAAAPSVDETFLGEALEELEWERWLVAEPRGYSLLARIVRDVILRDMVTSAPRGRDRYIYSVIDLPSVTWSSPTVWALTDEAAA
jgi:DNA-binding SARP family transcriptional activator